MSNCLLTIAIPTYNRCELLKIALDSILKQKNNKVEVVVYDNASTDGTEGLMKQYAQKEGVLYYRNPQNLGMDGNFLNCLNAGSGKYIHLMSDDDILLDGAIENMIRLIEKESPDYINLNSCAYWSETFDKNNVSAPRMTLEEDLITSDKGTIMEKLGVYITYISATILKRELVHGITSPEKYMGTHFLHAHIVLEALGKAEGKVVITKDPYLACKMNNSGGFDLYEVWIKQYKRLLLQTGVQNGFPKEIMKKIYVNDINGFIKDSILKYSVVDNDYVMKEIKHLFKNTWMYPSVWIKTYPIAYAPLCLKKYIYAQKRKKKAK